MQERASECDRAQVAHQYSPKTAARPTTPAPTPVPQDAEHVSEDSDEENGAPVAALPAIECPSRCLTDDR